MKATLNYSQICFVDKNRNQMSQKEIASFLGVSVIQVARAMKQFGWQKTKPEVRKLAAKKLKTKTTSTPDIDEYLRANYLQVPVKTIANRISKSGTFVRTRLRQLELVVPPEIIAQRKKDSRFKRGHVPENKGKKLEDFMNPETIKKFRKNQYTKGHLPHNTAAKDGEIRIRHEHPDRNGGRPYKYIRLSLGNWVQLHRHLWQQKHGPVPKGKCLWAKDGDSLNADPENWELITRAQNVRRNSGSKNLKDGYILGKLAPRDPKMKAHIREHYPELIELKRAELAANRKIKNHGQK